MSLCLRLVVLLVVSTVVFSPAAGFGVKCEDTFYIISLKDSCAKKKYKVRAFFLYPGIAVYNIPKMPKGWIYGFNDERSTRLIGAAQKDKDAVDIGYFKDFIILAITEGGCKKEIGFSMVLICNKPDGSPKIVVADTNDFNIKRIHKCLKWY